MPTGTRMTHEEYVERCTQVHNGFYGYDCTEYTKSSAKVKIRCPKHGIFEQRASGHIKGDGCRKCGRESQSRTMAKNTTERNSKRAEELVNKFNQIFDGFYSYPDLSDFRMAGKIKAICPVHGVFYPVVKYHLRGCGCMKCAKDRLAVKWDDFVDRANEEHNSFYTYPEPEGVFRSSVGKITILCPLHGEFQQIASAHLWGKGCRKCAASKGEKKVERYLKDRGIAFDQEVIYEGCRDKYPLRFDFEVDLGNRKVLVEYQGEQHFHPVDFAHRGDDWAQEIFDRVTRRDAIKRDYCKANNIPLLEISYKDFDRIEEVLDDWIAGLIAQ